MITEKLELEPFQVTGIDNISKKFASGKKSIIAVSPTGSGKTIAFSEITNRFISKSEKDVLILVHRDELFTSTRKTLLKWHNIVSEPINADTISINKNRVYVAMIETFNNRIQHSKFLEYFMNIGLVIVDEAHLSHFKKIFQYFHTLYV